MRKMLFVGILLVSCHNDKTIEESTTITHPHKQPSQSIDTIAQKRACLDSILLSNYQLIDVQSVDSTLKVDLKYATFDNFTRQQLYFHIDRAYLHKDVAMRLAKCNDYLKTIYPEYRLLIYDAVRPMSVQQKMWELLDSIPIAQRTKFVSNPKNHSIHNYGAAVDLTIVDQQGIPLDMGSYYDDIRQIAYPRMESYFLKKGELTAQQVANRTLLRSVMKTQNFTGITTEWWHFNAFPRKYVKQHYNVLSEEPSCHTIDRSIQQ